MKWRSLRRLERDRFLVWEFVAGFRRWSAGGKLYANLKLDTGTALEHDQAVAQSETCHALNTKGIFTELLGQSIKVNSFHRQAVAILPPDFKAGGEADDGLIEAAYADDGRTLGVKFHPELLYEKEVKWLAIFRVFVDYARKH